MPELARTKRNLWLEDTSLNLLNMFNMKFQEAKRRSLAQRRQQLMEAARDCKEETVVRRLALEACESNGWIRSATSLKEATREGEGEAEGPLLSFDEELYRALVSKCAEGHCEAVKLLLQAGANPLSATTKAATGKDKTGMHWALEQDRTDILQLLLEFKADPNMMFDELNPALIWSAMKGRTKAVEHLIKAGVRVEEQDATCYKRSSLMVACKNGDSETAERLIGPTKAAGALDLCDSEGMTSLMYASASGLSAIVEHLLAAGAKPQLVDKAKGRTSLMHACCNRRAHVCEKLIAPTKAVGALDKHDSEGMTSLMHASATGLAMVVEKLLAEGASSDLMDTNGRFGFMHACMNGHPLVAEILFERAANAKLLHLVDRCFKGGGESSLTHARKKVSVLAEARKPRSALSLLARNAESVASSAETQSSALALICNDISTINVKIAGLMRILDRLDTTKDSEVMAEVYLNGTNTLNEVVADAVEPPDGRGAQDESSGGLASRAIIEPAVVTTQGTANIEWTKSTGPDGVFGSNVVQQGAYVSITHQPEYANFSFEELRMQDYDIGRIKASAETLLRNAKAWVQDEAVLEIAKGWEQEKKAASESVDIARLREIAQALYDPNEKVQEEATRKFRTLLSIERNPPIQQVINAGVVPRFIELLTKWQCPTLQFEAAWALTNIASGTSEHTHMCVEKGAVPMFVQLLNSPNDDVREQAVWGLGNIAGDSAKLRDEVLNHNALMPLVRLLDPNTNRISLLRNATWTLSNFCRGKPVPPFDLVKPALPTLASLICSNDEEVLTDACWALSYLSDGTNEKIQAVIDAGVCRRLVELLMHQSAQVKTPALRTVGNIVTGDDQQTQYLINCGVVPCLHQLLSSERKGIRKETCWTISNITAGSKEQLQAVIDHNFIPVLVHMLETEDFDIRKECAWALSNATSGGDDLQIKYLVDSGCVPPLVNLLDKPDVRIVSVALEGLENILKCGQRNQNVDGTNPFVQVLQMCGGVDKIEDLQRHENHKIYDMAVKIIENYFGVDDDEEEPTL